jgi:hypothetical protein
VNDHVLGQHAPVLEQASPAPHVSQSPPQPSGEHGTPLHAGTQAEPPAPEDAIDALDVAAAPPAPEVVPGSPPPDVDGAPPDPNSYSLVSTKRPQPAQASAHATRRASGWARRPNMGRR